MNKPQHQGSLTDQILELITLANREGLYDAADWVRYNFEGAASFGDRIATLKDKS